MPNWCENTINVSGGKKGLDCFIKEQLADECVDFNRIVPMPEELKGTQAPSRESNEKLKMLYGVDNWYDWSLIHWGTKWNVNDASNTSIVRGKRSVCMLIDTAWSPPLPVIQAWSQRYPTLCFRIRYYEGGMGYCGRQRYRGGNLEDDHYNNNYTGHRGG